MANLQTSQRKTLSPVKRITTILIFFSTRALSQITKYTEDFSKHLAGMQSYDATGYYLAITTDQKAEILRGSSKINIQDSAQLEQTPGSSYSGFTVPTSIKGYCRIKDDHLIAVGNTGRIYEYSVDKPSSTYEFNILKDTSLSFPASSSNIETFTAYNNYCYLRDTSSLAFLEKNTPDVQYLSISGSEINSAHKMVGLLIVAVVYKDPTKSYYQVDLFELSNLASMTPPSSQFDTTTYNLENVLDSIQSVYYKVVTAETEVTGGNAFFRVLKLNKDTRSIEEIYNGNGGRGNTGIVYTLTHVKNDQLDSKYFLSVETETSGSSTYYLKGYRFTDVSGSMSIEPIPEISYQDTSNDLGMRTRLYSDCKKGHIWFRSSSQPKRAAYIEVKLTTNCFSSCKECFLPNDNLMCVSCPDGYSAEYSSGYKECWKDCTPDTQYNTNHETCESCPTGCSKCEGQGDVTCTECLEDYTLESGTCNSNILDCRAQNIKTYNIDNTNCGNCPVNCKSCLSSNLCDDCISGKRLKVTQSSPKAGECLEPCSTGTYERATDGYCVNCDSIDPKCTECSLVSGNPTCSNCISTHFLNPSKACELDCVKIDSKCTECSIVDNTPTCSKCETTHFLNPSKACELDCFKIDPKCTQCSIENNVPTCSNCMSTHFLNPSKACELDCVKIDSKCTECSIVDNTPTCSNCETTHFLNPSKACELDCPKIDPKCTECSIENNVPTCSNCENTHFLNPSKVCKLDCPKIDPKCTECSLVGGTPTCSNCMTTHFLNPSKACELDCVKIDPKCDECSLVNDNPTCSSCETTHFLPKSIETVSAKML